MTKDTCEFHKTCDSKCPSYKVQCLRYCQLFTKRIISKVGPQKLTPSDIKDAPLLHKGVYSSLSRNKISAVIIKRLQSKLTPVKVYHFSTAIDACINEELPNEEIVFIDTTNKYKDSSKGLQVISTFAQKLGETKLVIIKVEAGALGEEVKTLC